MQKLADVYKKITIDNNKQYAECRNLAHYVTLMLSFIHAYYALHTVPNKFIMPSVIMLSVVVQNFAGISANPFCKF